MQDEFDSPYGLVKTRDGSGHSKPTHLHANVAAVQDMGVALVLNDLTMSIESTTHGGPFTSLAANVLFPSGAGIDRLYVNGFIVNNVTRGECCSVCMHTLVRNYSVA